MIFYSHTISLTHTLSHIYIYIYHLSVSSSSILSLPQNFNSDSVLSGSEACLGTRDARRGVEGDPFGEEDDIEKDLNRRILNDENNIRREKKKRKPSHVCTLFTFARTLP